MRRQSKILNLPSFVNYQITELTTLIVVNRHPYYSVVSGIHEWPYWRLIFFRKTTLASYWVH